MDMTSQSQVDLNQSEEITLQDAVILDTESSFEDYLNSLVLNGYCAIQLDPISDVKQKAMQIIGNRVDFVPLRPSTAEAYLGRDATRSVVISYEYQSDPADPLFQYFNYIDRLSSLLIEHSSIFGVGLVDSFSAGAILRKDFAPDDSGFRPPKLEEVDETDVDEFINFVRRRRLCLMQFIECAGGSVELFPRSEQNSYEPVRIPVGPDKLIIFRHDLFEYSYVSQGTSFVLQGWLLDEPLTWPGGIISGTVEEIASALGARGSPMPKSDAVQIKSIGNKNGGNGLGPMKIELAYKSLTDCFMKIPLARWDHDIYFSFDRDDGRGLSGVRHAGLLQEDDLMSFDYERFDLSREEAHHLGGTFFLNLECGYETLFDAGFDKKTLKGSDIDCFVAGAQREGEMPKRLANPCSRFTSNYQEHFIMMHLLGLTGRGSLIDTACSASNVANNMAFQNITRARDCRKYGLRCEKAPGSERALIIGSMLVYDPLPFVGLSQAHMLGNTGRCKTYDSTADGYARAEGVGCGYLCLDEKPEHLSYRCASMIGGFVNQDGRSASLTAPNGPSQSALIRESLQVCQRSHLDVDVSEMHGTGTAIGDPIETGSLRVVMLTKRVQPLFHQAGKSMTGHLEVGAGITGIIKTIRAARSGCALPQCHLQGLNPNIDMEAYPAFWPTEVVDLDTEYIHAGISSFGFGGTNARTDIWTTVQSGAHSVGLVNRTSSGAVAMLGGPSVKSRRLMKSVDMFLTSCAACNEPMCWKCGEASCNFYGLQHVCKDVREDIDSYPLCSNCYDGAYLLRSQALQSIGDAGDPGQPVYIRGSWSNFLDFEEMQYTGSSYVHFVDVDTSRYVQFTLALDSNPDLTIYPPYEASDMNGRVLGPDSKSNGRSWLIDITRDCGHQNGTFCKIEFTWDYGVKRVSWGSSTSKETKQKDTIVRSTALAQSQSQRFSIVATYNDWKFEDLTPSSEEEGLWETTFRIGYSGVEEFQLAADGSFSKAIYPDGYRVMDTAVPILGPDDRGTGKNWYVLGLIGSEVTIQLRVRESSLSVTASSSTFGKRTWHTAGSSVVRQRRYFMVGSSNEWSHEMAEDTSQPGLYTASLQIPDDKTYEEFQIAVDQNRNQIVSGCLLHSMGINLSEDRGSYVCDMAAGLWIEVSLDTRFDPVELTCRLDVAKCRALGAMR